MTTQAPRGIPAEYAGASIVGGHEQSSPIARTKEADEHMYARMTRNATVFIAVIVGILTLFSVIAGIYVAVTIGSLVSSTTGGGGGSGGSFNIYNCQSLGGTDSSC
jgi:hypothetical protein